MIDNQGHLYIAVTTVNQKCEICGTPGPNLHPQWLNTPGTNLPSVLCRSCLDEALAVMNAQLAIRRGKSGHA